MGKYWCTMADQEQCFVCGEVGELYECNDCQSAVYCSRKCQKEDYATGHRIECAQFIAANGDTADQRRLARRALRKRRRILRGQNRRLGPNEPVRQARVTLENGREVVIRTDLQPGEYEIYETDVRVERRRARLRRSGKIVERVVIYVITHIQTRSQIDRQNNTVVTFKPVIEPTASQSGEGPACVEIECPPQFPAGTTCWRCIEAIAAPSEGEEGEAEQNNTFNLFPPQEQPDDDDDPRFDPRFDPRIVQQPGTVVVPRRDRPRVVVPRRQDPRVVVSPRQRPRVVVRPTPRNPVVTSPRSPGITLPGGITIGVRSQLDNEEVDL